VIGICGRRSYRGLLPVRLNQSGFLLTKYKPIKGEKTKKTKNRTMATLIALFLTLIIAIPLGALPSVLAYGTATQTAIDQGMYWVGMGSDASATRLLLWYRFHDKIPTYCYAIAAPNPVGVGQSFNIVMFNPQVPPNSALSNNIRYQYTMVVTKPDGTTQNLPTSGTYVSDPTGATFTFYTPDQVGNYSFKVTFLQLQYLWNSTIGGGDNNYYGTTFLSSSYTLPIVVQQTPVSLIGEPLIPPLPTEYWTRPIEGQNTEWYHVASNWLSGPHDRDNGGAENRYQADGVAPNSPHILWTRPTEDNGVVGGNDLSRAGNVFNAGSQYQPRFTNQIIMYGRLYYSPNVYTSGSSSLMDCVDLKTGKLIYEVDTKGANVAGLLGVSTTANMPQFGYYYSQDDPNEHGIQNPGWLFTSNYVIGYQPERGIPYLNILNVPSGFEVQNSAGAGENLRYVLTNLGNSTNPNYYLAQWNSSKVIPMIGAGSNPTNLPIYGNCPITPARVGNLYWNGSAWGSVNSTLYALVTSPAYDWNVSVALSFSGATLRAAQMGDILWGSTSWPTGTSSTSYAFQDNVTVFAISLNPSSLGQVLYTKALTTDFPTINTNIIFERATAAEGVFVGLETPMCKFHVYDMRTGNERFVTDAQADASPYGYFTWPSLISQTQTKCAYGFLYTAGYSGSVSAYNLTTGKLAWRYTAPSGGEKIQNFVLMEALICDGKVYVGTHEHSADTPLYKAERIRCLDAFTGDALWTMSGWAYPMTFAVADGVLIYWNNYDAQIYALGMGPSATTVQAPLTAITAGDNAVIQGTVTDISAGTEQDTIARRFPNGVPAVSDDSMSQWMEYVYMQKARPSNTTGVTVSIDAVDPNNNFVHIGTATSDTSGLFSCAWTTPDVPGKYTVLVTFAGSKSYYASYAETAMYVQEAPPSPTPTPAAAPLPPYEMYILLATVVLLIAIAIVGILLLRKRA
jgi:outer membrane protein assembly factor BamB